MFSKMIFLLLMIIFSIFFIKENKKHCTNNTLIFSLKEIFIFSLLPAYKFIYLYANNINNIPFYFGIIIIFAACLIFLILYTVINFVIKNQYQSVIISLIASFMMYNAGYISISDIFSVAALTVLILTCLLSFNIENIMNFLKTFILTLLVLCLIQGGYKLINSINFSELFPVRHKTAEVSIKNITKFSDKDIYIIILDMYAGSFTLNQMGFDNSHFITELKKSGFNVFENIDSNYNKTLLSLSSFLNLKYLENINYETSSEAINYAELFKIAKSAGYKIYYINSWPVELRLNRGEVTDEVYNSDYYVTGAVLNLFLDNTIFKGIVYMAEKENPVENSISLLKRIIKNHSSEKKFILAHFLMPHEPFLFDEYGNELPLEERDYIIHTGSDLKTLNQKSYISFLKYANKKTLDIVNEILNTDKKTKPIIIIMGDHGPRIIRYEVKEKKHMEEISLYHKNSFNTFLAFYNPESNMENYNKTNSLLNFYINFTNETFGTEKENLPDKKFYNYLTSQCLKIHRLEGEFVK